jgi:hypothetical protein
LTDIVVVILPSPLVDPPTVLSASHCQATNVDELAFIST